MRVEMVQESNIVFKFYIFTDVFLLVGTFSTKKGNLQYIRDAAPLDQVYIVEDNENDKSIVLAIASDKYSFFFDSPTDLGQFKELLKIQTELVKKSKLVQEKQVNWNAKKYGK